MIRTDMPFTTDERSSSTAAAADPETKIDDTGHKLVMKTVKTNVINNGDNDGQMRTKSMDKQEEIKHCTRCKLYQERLRGAETRMRKLEKLKLFCHKEIKTLREDLSRAKNLIAQQSVKLEQIIPSEGPPWIVPSDENAVMKPNVDYFSCRTFDKNSSLPLGNPSSSGKTCTDCQLQNSTTKIIVPPQTTTRARTKEKINNNNKVGFVMPQSLNQKDIDPESFTMSPTGNYYQPRSKSAPSPKTYLDMHRLRKLRNEKLNHQQYTVHSPNNNNNCNFNCKVQNLAQTTTTGLNTGGGIRSKSLPRNSKLNIVISSCSSNNDNNDNSKIQKMTRKLSNVEILAIAVASREGLIREIAHSIRKAKRILHFRFDMLITSDFDLEDFHFLLTSHRRFIRWLHNYVNYSRALLGRFDEQHLIGSWSRGRRKRIKNTDTTTTSIIDNRKVTPDLRFACTQTVETKLFLKKDSTTTTTGKSLAIQTVTPQQVHFEQNFETMFQSHHHISSTIFDHNQEFSFTSKRNLSKPSRGLDEEKQQVVPISNNIQVQDQGTCTQIEEDCSKNEENMRKEIGTGVEYIDNGQGSNELLQFKRNVALQYIASTTNHHTVGDEGKIHHIPTKEAWTSCHHRPQVKFNNNIINVNTIASNCAANFHNTVNDGSEDTNSLDEFVKTCHSIVKSMDKSTFQPPVKQDSFRIGQLVKDSTQSVQMEQLWFTQEDLAPKINSSILSQNTDLNVYKPLCQVANDDHQDNDQKNHSKQELLDEENGDHDKDNKDNDVDVVKIIEESRETYLETDHQESDHENDENSAKNCLSNEKIQDPSPSPPTTMIHCYQPLDGDVQRCDENFYSNNTNDRDSRKSNAVTGSRASNSEASLGGSSRLSLSMTTGHCRRPSPLDLIEEHHMKEAENFYNHRGNLHIRSLEPNQFFSNMSQKNEISDDNLHQSRSRKRRTPRSSKSPLRLPTSMDYKCMEKYFENNVKKYKQYLSNPEAMVEGNLPKFPTAAQVVLDILHEQTSGGGGKEEDGKSKRMTTDGEKYSPSNDDHQKIMQSDNNNTHHPCNDDDKTKELNDFDSFIHNTKNLLKEQISQMCHTQLQQASVYQPVDTKMEEEEETKKPGQFSNNISLKEFLELTNIHKDTTETTFSMEQLNNKKSRPQFIFQDFKTSRHRNSKNVLSNSQSSPTEQFKNGEEKEKKEEESSSHHHNYQKSSPVTSSRLPVPSRPPLPKMMVVVVDKVEILKKDTKQEIIGTSQIPAGIAEIQIPASLKSHSSKASFSNKLAKFSDKMKDRSFIPVKTKTKPKDNNNKNGPTLAARGITTTGKILHQTSVKRLEKVSGPSSSSNNPKPKIKDRAVSFSTAPSSSLNTTKNSCRQESSSRPRCRESTRAKSPRVLWDKTLARTRQWGFCKTNANNNNNKGTDDVGVGVS